jgi:hypothetical protein
MAERKLRKTLITGFILGLAAAYFLIACKSLHADPGVAYYAIQHKDWPCDRTLKVFEGVAKPSLSVLWHSFGDNTQCLEKFINDSRPKQLEIHLINEVCQRNRRCGPYEFLANTSTADYEKRLASRDPKLISAIKNYAKAPSEFLKRHQGKFECYVSPGLESNLSDRGAKTLNDAIRPMFPGCAIVRNPAGINRARGLAGAEIIEVHGPNPRISPECIANLDGNDVSFARRPALLTAGSINERSLMDYLTRMQKCRAAYIWTAEMNGLNPHDKGFVDPRKRSNFPDANLIEAMKPHLQGKKPVAFQAPALQRGCARMHNPFDGAGGFVWKQSDVHPGAVAVFPSSFSKFAKVDVIRSLPAGSNSGASGKQVISGNPFMYGGLGNPDTNGKNRQHWRTPIRARDFARNSILRADGHCWILSNPGSRID